MAYVKHKPQYRTPRSSGGRATGRPRDIRRVLPDARGKVILPDSTGLPRRASFGSPALAKRSAFGKAGSTFSPPVMKGRAPSVWWRGGAAQLAPAMRGAVWFMAAYDIYRSVDRMLGGEPYTSEAEVLFGGGPNGNYTVATIPDVPGKSLVIPTPDGMPGWYTHVHSSYVFSVLTGRNGYYDERRRNYPDIHNSPGNELGEYTIADIRALGPPPFQNAFHQWECMNRIQRGGLLSEPANWTSLMPPRVLWQRPIADPRPVIGPWPGPVILPVSSPSPGDISEAWPSQVGQASRLLPHGSPWVSIPWSAVKAVNQVRGALGIREENFLDDVGGPRPVRKPELNHKPPPKGQKEKKGRSNNGNLLLFYNAVKKAWHEIDEHVEKVDILYDALPGWVRNRERAKLPHEKVAALLRNWQHIDVGEAVYGLIENEVEDAAFGRGFKSLEQAFEKMGVRGWRGQLAMSYSTDALFELYGALKGGL